MTWIILVFNCCANYILIIAYNLISAKFVIECVKGNMIKSMIVCNICLICSMGFESSLVWDALQCDCYMFHHVHSKHLIGVHITFTTMATTEIIHVMNYKVNLIMFQLKSLSCFTPQFKLSFVVSSC